MTPLPGTATRADLETIVGKHCELVDGTLVEKPMGFLKSYLASDLIILLGTFVKQHNLGMYSGEDGFYELFPHLVRGPDVAFASWSRIPGRRVPDEPFPATAPEFVVEILSPSNTRAEMVRKRKEYFSAGVNVVWEVEPRDRVVTVYSSATDPGREHGPDDTLIPGSFLPGLSISLKDWFACLDRHG
jgi:Uma2 family endonuclease